MPLGVLALPVVTEVPVEPDAEQARRWAEDELAKAIYDQQPSLLDRITEWFLDLLEAVSDLGGTTPPELVPLVLVAVGAGVFAVAVLLGGRVRRRRAVTGETSHALFDDARSSEQLRAGADAAAARGDYAAAVLDRFRAIVRHLDERTLLDDRPGLTAHEAAELAGAALPEHLAGLRWAGQLFDDVRYGEASPGRAEDDALRALADQVAATRPAVGA